MRKLAMLICALLLFSSACASVALRADSGAALVDRSGHEIVPFGAYSDIVPIGNDLFAAVRESECALMDSSGTLLTGFDFDHILLKDDLLLANRDGKWCVLNPDGTARTEAVYGLIVPNGSGGAWAIHGVNGDMVSDELLTIDENGAVNQTGLFVRSMDERAGNGLIAALPSDTSSYIYCDIHGKPAFDQSFDTAGGFTGGIALVTVGEKYAAINAEGEMALPAQYDFADVSEDGKVLAVNDSAALAIESDGKEILYYEGKNLSAAFAGEHILIYNGENLLVYAPDGQKLYDLDPLASLYSGMDGQLILSDGAWGEKCVSIAGDEDRFQNLVPLGYADGDAVYAFAEFRVARYMNNLLGEVQLSADMDTARYGIADSNGETLLPAIYESVEYLEDDRFLVRLDGRWRMIDSKGVIYWQTEAVSDD